MLVRVLGSGAGGGVPQWNCACRICRAVRAGTRAIVPRSQASAAISGDGVSWYLLHASPDVRLQIESFQPLHPRGTRDSPIAGILLSNGDLDACLGLLSLRESQPLSVHATSAVTRGFRDGNPLVRTLERFPDQIKWIELGLGAEVTLRDGDGRPTGLDVTAVAVPGKVPLHLVGRQPPSDEDNVALRVRDRASGRVLVWAPRWRTEAGPRENPPARPIAPVRGNYWSSYSGRVGPWSAGREMGNGRSGAGRQSPRCFPAHGHARVSSK